jgi:Competence protein CoiA-like family
VHILNSLGFMVGADEGSARLVFGVDKSGRMTGIDEAVRGAGCGLLCPECSAPLVARKGDIKVHHFAHAPGSGCLDEQGALETQAHRFAKEVLTGSSLLLPSFSYLGEAGDYVKVLAVSVEESRGPIRPDLVCSVAWEGGAPGRGPRVVELAVEIRVTHRVDAVKGKAFAEQRLRCIEIDLARYRYSSDDEIRRAVISDAPRRWVWKKPPMPVDRPVWPSGPVPRRGRTMRPPARPDEFTAEDWAAFNRRHP